VRAGSYEGGRANDEENFAREGFLKQSGTLGEADM
jgi:hypothetical protein